MDTKDSVCDPLDLEHMLVDERAEPRHLRISLLESITNNFSDDMVIGSGGFAVVYKGLLPNHTVAVKKLTQRLDVPETKLEQEVYNLMRVKHKNIVRYLGYCFDVQKKVYQHDGKIDMAEERQWFLCFEYLPWSLDKYIKDPCGGHGWSTCYQIIKGICEGLHYLHHQQKIVHLDLKPANILLDHDMVPKIADFGLSKCFDEKQTHLTASNPCGSLGYMAPEVHRNLITFKSDIFSLGIIILEMLTGQKNPETDYVLIERWKMSEGDPLLEHVRKCVNLGQECSDLRAAERPKVERIIEKLDKMEVEAMDPVMEHMLLDESVEPTCLPLSFLELITNNFSADNIIGRGGLAVVYKGLLKNGAIAIAVKRMNQQVNLDERRFNEMVSCLVRVKHKNIVRFLGYCAATEEHEGKVVTAKVQQSLLCFEYLPYGSLDKYITSDTSGGLEWRTRYKIIKGICEGLNYLHQKNIFHLDLKPANILLNNNMLPKITVSSLSRRFDENQNQTITSRDARSVGYMAPESYSGVVTKKADIYGIGILIIEILTGQKGYSAIEEVLESWSIRLETIPGFSELIRECAEIGIECTDFNPEKRPDSRHIIERLDEMERRYGLTEIDPGTSIFKHARSSTSELLDETQRAAVPEASSSMQQIISAPKGPRETHYLGPSAISKQLEVYPLEIHFPFEPCKRIESPVTLTNRTNRYIGVWITPAHQDTCYYRFPVSWGGKSLEDPSFSVFEMLKPHSTKAVDMTFKEHWKLPMRDTGMFKVLMMVMRSEEDLANVVTDLKLHITMKLNMDSRFFKRVEGSGGEIHQAMLKTIVYEPAIYEDSCKFIPAPRWLWDIEGIDVHPTKTWILTAHNWWVCIWNYRTQKREILQKIFTNKSGSIVSRVYSVKFVAREKWFAAGDEDGHIHVYNYATTNKVKEFQAHDNTRIDSLAVHLTSPFMLTASSSVPFLSDNCIKLWDWSQDWSCIGKFDNQSGSVLGLTWNHLDTVTFASASYGGAKIWEICSSDATITWPHSKAVFGLDSNCRRNVVVTCAWRDDNCAWIWDMQTTKCVHKLFISNTEMWDIACHPTLPIWVTTSGRTIRLWDARTCRVEKIFQLMDTPLRGGMVFIGTNEDSARLVVGCKKGIAIVEINLPTLKTEVEIGGER